MNFLSSRNKYGTLIYSVSHILEYLRRYHMFITSADYVSIDKQETLKTHFHEYFALFCENSRQVDGLYRYVMDIPSPSLNAVLGTVAAHADDRIAQELSYFKQKKLPFIWYVDEGSDASFQAKLIEHGFQDIGIFRGVMGPLDQQVTEQAIPAGCAIEQVTTPEAMEEFNELISCAFGIDDASKHLFKQKLWNLAQADKAQIYLWLGRKNGVAVSALSTFVEGPLVSFWTAASDPSIRQQGFCTAVLKTALKDAIGRGCTFGASYLAAPGLAFGICTQLGYEPKWEFHAYISP